MAERIALPAGLRSEIATTKRVRELVSSSFVDTLLQPEDEILRARGGDWVQRYGEVLRDDQVKACFQQRTLALIGKEWVVESGDASETGPAKEAADELRTQLEAIEWDRICEKMLYGIFYGFMVSEVLWTVRDGRVAFEGIRVKKPGKFRWDIDGRLRFITLENPAGEVMPERKFWTYDTGATHDDDPYGLGLAHWLYWPVFFKRNGMKFWLVFAEKFAQPTATAKVPAGIANDPLERQKVLDALRALQVDSAVVVPDNVAIELVEAARSGTQDYDTLVERLNRSIAKVILSQTMTTDDGSSRAQADVHMDVREEVVEADRDLLCESFNRGPARWWTDWNYGPKVPAPKVWRITEVAEDLNKRAERDTKIHGLGFDPTPQYIEDTYGPGWEKREAMQPPITGAGDLDALREFAEFAGVRGHRADQQQLADAAHRLASDYRGVIGQRIEDLVGYLENTGDLATFKKRINELLEQGPPKTMIDKLLRARFVARALGHLRAQR